MNQEEVTENRIEGVYGFGVGCLNPRRRRRRNNNKGSVLLDATTTINEMYIRIDSM